MLSRRLFLGGLLASTAAPAIVRASSLMPIWVPKPWVDPWGEWLRTRPGPYESALHRMLLDNAELACNPPLIGVDHGDPRGDWHSLTLVSNESGLITFHHERVNPWR